MSLHRTTNAPRAKIFLIRQPTSSTHPGNRNYVWFVGKLQQLNQHKLQMLAKFKPTIEESALSKIQILSLEDNDGLGERIAYSKTLPMEEHLLESSKPDTCQWLCRGFQAGVGADGAKVGISNWKQLLYKSIEKLPLTSTSWGPAPRLGHHFRLHFFA
jgi:hypothetical protein